MALGAVALVVAGLVALEADDLAWGCAGAVFGVLGGPKHAAATSTQRHGLRGSGSRGIAWRVFGAAERCIRFCSSWRRCCPASCGLVCSHFAHRQRKLEIGRVFVYLDHVLAASLARHTALQTRAHQAAKHGLAALRAKLKENIMALLDMEVKQVRRGQDAVAFLALVGVDPKVVRLVLGGGRELCPAACNAAAEEFGGPHRSLHFSRAEALPC